MTKHQFSKQEKKERKERGTLSWSQLCFPIFIISVNEQETKLLSTPFITCVKFITSEFTVPEANVSCTCGELKREDI